MNSVAQKLNLELPVAVSRDAFNVESCGTALVGKTPDRGPGPWANAVNSKIVCTQDSETQIQMGRVRALDSPTYSVKQGALPLAVVSSRSALGARATASNLLPQLAMMKIGFARTISPLTADNVFVEATRLDLESPLTHFALAIKKTVNNSVTTVASVPYFTASDAVNLHLVVDLHGTATATLYADSTLLVENVALNLTSTFMNNLAFAYFRGERTSTKYAFRPTDGEVDDFEADIYCSDTNPPFNCVP